LIGFTVVEILVVLVPCEVRQYYTGKEEFVVLRSWIPSYLRYMG
jgi:hypothetical protein